MISTASVAGVGYYTGSGDGARDEHARARARPTTRAPRRRASRPAAGAAGWPSSSAWPATSTPRRWRSSSRSSRRRTGSKVGRPPMQFRSIESRIEQALALEPNALPERVEQIKAEVARSTRSSMAGMDLTFSVPKSVTVAHTAAWRVELESTRSGDADRAAQFRSIREGIEGAIVEANDAAMEYASTLSTSRRGSSTGRARSTGSPRRTWPSRSFFQHTSRADDPQLHVHNVVLNRARNERRADPGARHRRPARPAARLLRRRRPRARRAARRHGHRDGDAPGRRLPRGRRRRRRRHGPVLPAPPGHHQGDAAGRRARRAAPRPRAQRARAQPPRPDDQPRHAAVEVRDQRPRPAARPVGGPDRRRARLAACARSPSGWRWPSTPAPSHADGRSSARPRSPPRRSRPSPRAGRRGRARTSCSRSSGGCR